MSTRRSSLSLSLSCVYYSSLPLLPPYARAHYTTPTELAPSVRAVCMYHITNEDKGRAREEAAAEWQRASEVRDH